MPDLTKTTNPVNSQNSMPVEKSVVWKCLNLPASLHLSHLQYIRKLSIFFSIIYLDCWHGQCHLIIHRNLVSWNPRLTRYHTQPTFSCSKSTIQTIEQYVKWHRSGVFTANFQKNSHIVPVFTLLSLNKQIPNGSHFI